MSVFHAIINAFTDALQNQHNQFLSGGLVLMVLGAIVAYARRLPGRGISWLQRRFIITLDITNEDPVFFWMAGWLSQQPYTRRARNLSVTTYRDHYGNVRNNSRGVEAQSAPTSTSNDRIEQHLPEIILTPAPGHHIFFYKHRPLWLVRTRADAQKDPQSGGFGLFNKEGFQIRMIARSQARARALIEEARALSYIEREVRTDIYVMGYEGFRRVDSCEPRPISTVFLPEGQVDEIVGDIRKFLANKAWYTTRGIPWRRGFLFYGIPGTGKCLGKGTPVLMFDGSIKPVEDIRPGDRLMGPDSRPRLVLSTCSGNEELFKVNPIKGEPHVVNRSHVLSLKMSTRYCGSPYQAGDVVNLSVNDFIERSVSFKHWAKLYRTGVEFRESQVHLDPYILGIWLGDGHSAGPRITTMDPEVVTSMEQFASRHSLSIRAHSGNSGKAKVYAITSGTHGAGDIKEGRNPFLSWLKDYGVLNNKHIPAQYKTNSRKVRLEVLAGLIDSDGHLSGGGYDYISKSERLSDDVVYLARSLGFAAYKTPCLKKWTSEKYNGDGTYFRVSISGDLSVVPTRIARKRAPSRQQVKDVLHTGFTLESQGVGDYFGFEIDGDGLFLLGDFTVTHNTTLIRALVGEFKMDLYLISLSSGLDDRTLQHALASIPPRSAILLEDADASFDQRKKNKDVKGSLSFSGLLNALDGAASREGWVVFMTTNHLNRLDPALIRPGRTDVHLEFTHATAYQASSMFTAFFPTAAGGSSQTFGRIASQRALTMADVQKHLIIHQDSAVDALAALDVPVVEVA